MSVLRQILIALTLSALACAAPLAQSPAEQAYIDYQTGLAIDDRCHFLRHFERQNISDIDEELLRPLNLYIDYAETGQDVDAINAERARLVELANATARNIACTDNQSAAPYILGLRDRIAHYLYAHMLIGLESGRMSDEQKRAAQLFEAMFTPLYGENWQGFVDHATKRAQLKIDTVLQQDQQSNIFESLWGPDFYDDYLYWDEEEDYSYDPFASRVYFDALLIGALKAADDIVFDLTVEEAGYRVQTHLGEKGGHVTAFFDPQGERKFDLWQVPSGYYAIEKAGPVKLAFAVNDLGEGRIMSYGEQAKRLAAGSITFLIHPDALPSNQSSDFTLLRSAEWWDAAQIIEAEPVDEPCLGGPCFALPASALDLIRNGPSGQAFRFFLSIHAEPTLPAPDNPEIYTGYNYALQSRDTFLASQNQ